MERVMTMTVDQLRARLVGVDGSLEVILRVRNDEAYVEGEVRSVADVSVGGLVDLDVDKGCTDTLALILDADYHAASRTWCSKCRSEIIPGTGCNCEGSK